MRNRLPCVPGLLAALTAAALLFVAADPRTADAGQVITETVAYAGEGGPSGFLARPSDEGRYPALVLIHEWWGLNGNIRENAIRFAEAGYVALAVDLYHGKVAATPDEARTLAGAVRENADAAFANLSSAVEYLRGRDFVEAERLASVGWCFGGGWSYQMAKNDLGVKASVIYYGFFNPADDLEKMRADIIGHFGEEDRAIKVDDVKQFQARLKTLNGDHEIYIYPNAGHAFANEDSENYDREAAEKAWERTQAFLKENL